jgi:hypothetical protein
MPPLFPRVSRRIDRGRHVEFFPVKASFFAMRTDLQGENPVLIYAATQPHVVRRRL